jgi:UDP-N-acetylglucosamine--N-acetylmuramyl-(pentapeptide) pyrophosphoryl-undecaprenol N-acetylglucosamine transferase
MVQTESSLTRLDFQGALVFTGGGTGGHYFPAVALAEGVRTRWPETPICFVGAQRGIEARRLPESVWPHLLLDVEGFLGRSPLRVLKSTAKLWRTTSVLTDLWRNQRPKAVIGTGGYGSAPALLAARVQGIPFFIHESNAQPGMVTRVLAGGARRVWCGMDAIQARLPRASCLPVGTPVRKEFLRDFSDLCSRQPPYRVLVLGGSGGAKALNEAVFAMASDLLERFPQWEILHQTGSGDFSELSARQRHPRHIIAPFLEAMDQEIEAASLVVSRSGASTCSELKATGRPSLLVPMPGSASDHQTLNARAMVEEGRAILLVQTPDFASKLAEGMTPLMESLETRQALSHPEPNRAVALCLEDLAKLLD